MLFAARFFAVRTMKLENNLNSTTQWEIFEDRFVTDQQVTTGSNYMIGNGYLGYRGTFADDRAKEYVACVVTDTYDNADGVWKELVTAPNGLYTELSVDGEDLRWRDAAWSDYRRELNFRYGEWSVEATWKKRGLTIREDRTASITDHHLLMSRTTITAHRRMKLGVRTGIDGYVWSLNGEHFVSYSATERDGELEVHTVTGEHGYDLVVREQSILEFADGMQIESHLTDGDDKHILRGFDLELDPQQTITVTKYVAVYSTNDLRRSANPFTAVPVPEHPVEPAWRGVHPASAATELRHPEETLDAMVGRLDPERPELSAVRAAASSTIQTAREIGWEALLEQHRAAWDRRWTTMDVEIEGDATAQTVLRYNLYHNIIATPSHTDHLPVGARGLSCQAYQGAAFWDQEVFNFPMFLFTAPEIARNILMYRYRTLDGARRKARQLGYRGAFYAWISGDSGEEICPSYFFKDVLSGRPIRNHFNDWQIHVSPDIAYTVRRYVTVTHDWDYLKHYGAEIVFEIARFLVSRSHFRSDTGQYEILRVLGPDEYHENVDNNFFTNYQARFTAAYATEVYRWMEEQAPGELRELQDRIGLYDREVQSWTDLAARLRVAQPEPETGIIPQFDGFFELEDTDPTELRNRLLDTGEYWGWPNGVAVATQVSKQADVTQLFVLHPTAFDREIMKKNWEYYEPRTQHGSSLSPAVYAIVAAWVGHMEEAERYFMKSCTIDLYNDNKAVSGGTFIGGIHTAACGVSWQIVISGFAGMYLTDGGFGFRPHLPESWKRLSFAVERWGVVLRVEIRGGQAPSVSVSAPGDAARTLTVAVGDTERPVAPGETVAF